MNEALRILEQDKEVCRKMAEVGLSLIEEGDTILTHCNAGGLATADYGTALGVVYKAQEVGKQVKVYVDETRPFLQGARLTTWELMREGIDTTLICDGTAGMLISEGKISKVLVGADRIAANGDCANKVGTATLAILADFYHIPFYVVSPTSSFDLTLSNGEEIPIEERQADEVTTFYGRRIAPPGVKVYNPAFDITPGRLITAIITEKGIAKPPYEESLAKIIK